MLNLEFFFLFSYSISSFMASHQYLSVVLLFCRLKIFAPITVLALGILVPVNWTGGTLEKSKDLTFSDIDKLSISNIELGSQRFFLSFLFLLSKDLT